MHTLINATLTPKLYMHKHHIHPGVICGHWNKGATEVAECQSGVSDDFEIHVTRQTKHSAARARTVNEVLVISALDNNNNNNTKQSDWCVQKAHICMWNSCELCNDDYSALALDISCDYNLMLHIEKLNTLLSLKRTESFMVYEVSACDTATSNEREQKQHQQHQFQ